MACVMASSAPLTVHAAFINVDPSAHTLAGSQQAPHMAWTAEGFLPCNKYVVPTNKPGGFMLGTGDLNDPWQSIKMAMRNATAGQTVCVRAGVYQENHLVPKNTGTWENGVIKDIVLVAYPGPVTIVPNTEESIEEIEKPVFDFEDTQGPIGFWGIDSFTIERGWNGVNYDGGGLRLQGLNNPGYGIHHIAFQNVVIRNGKAPSGVLLRGRVSDVLMRNVTVENFHRWVHKDNTKLVSYNPLENYRRFDSHGIAIEGTVQSLPNPIYRTPQQTDTTPTYASVERVSIEKSHFLNNGGDGIQCLGAAPNESAKSTSDPLNIDIVDNRVVANAPGTTAVEEDGYDIKSCQNVSIRGTKKILNPANPENIAPSASTMSGLISTYPANDLGSNNSDGTGIILHYFARNVLIENNRISNSCNGIKVGLKPRPTDPQWKVQNVVIRGNLINDLKLYEIQPNQQGTHAPTTEELKKCRGTGIQVTNANHVDIYHNTVQNISTAGIQLASGYEAGEPGDTSGIVPNNVDIWNNVLSLKDQRAVTTPQRVPGYWINYTRSDMQNIDSNYNLLWHPDGSENHFGRYPSTSMVSWATWKSGSDARDTHSLWNAPQFKTGADYFTLATSPARDTALNNIDPRADIVHPACPVNKPDIGYVETCQ